MKTRYWWLVSSHPVLLGLLFEGLLFAIWALANKRFLRLPRWPLLLVAPALFFVVSFFVGFEIGLWLIDGLLIAALCASLVIDPNPRWLVLARAAPVLIALAVGVVRSTPSMRSTSELVDVGAYVTKFKMNDGWLFDELRSRPDTRETLETRLNFENESAVLLHAQLGFPLETRTSGCQLLLKSPRPRDEIKAACSVAR